MLTALQVEVNCAVMTELLIGYARVSTNEQDLTAQQNALERLGVRPNLIYTDHGLTGTNPARPGLREALAACRSGAHSWWPNSIVWPGRFGMQKTSSMS